MLATAAAQLGFRTITLDPDPNAPAAQVCNDHIVADYTDADALDRLAQQSDVTTYEFENVPLQAAERIAGHTSLCPPAKALEVSQDRLSEKMFLRQAGLSVAPFHAIETVDDLVAATAEFNGGVLKTRRFGYDGKGQHVFDGACDESAADKVMQSIGSGPYVLEKRIRFEGEFSVVAARTQVGEFRAFEPALNVHQNGILRSSTVPSGLPTSLLEQATAMTQNLMDELNYVGVIGVEFFYAPGEDEVLLVNEFAPRVHNSGHWTEHACFTSQFEQHIRAICGLPLGAPDHQFDCVMENLLGDEASAIAPYLADPKCRVTLYGKTEARPGRKMGHMTRLAR